MVGVDKNFKRKKGNKKKIGKVKKKSNSKVINLNKQSKPFPLEMTTGPEQLDAKDITTFFNVGQGKYKTDDDVLKNVFNYEKTTELGHGGFGAVFIAINTKTKAHDVVKLCKIGDQLEGARLMDMKNELFIMERVKHFFIVKMLKHFVTNSKYNGYTLYIIMEMADGGDFSKFCHKNGTMTESDSKLYFAQMLCGVNHLHLMGIGHRDIKLENVLLKKDKRALIGDYILLICDFGLSRIMHHAKSGKVEMNFTKCGTPVYMAPEILQKKPYNSFSVDVWALGIALMIMLTLKPPFDYRDEAKMIKDMLERNWYFEEEKMKDKPTEQLNKLMKRLLEPMPRKRITMPDLLKHPWIADSYAKAQQQANKNKIR